MAADGEWRHSNVGRQLYNAIDRFERRVFELLRHDGSMEISAFQLHLTRNLGVEGARLSVLAQRASITKQAMGELVTECERKGLVERRPDPSDGRAKIILFTEKGLVWLDKFSAAIVTAEEEMRAELGEPSMEALLSALKAYGRNFDALR